VDPQLTGWLAFSMAVLISNPGTPLLVSQHTKRADIPRAPYLNSAANELTGHCRLTAAQLLASKGRFEARELSSWLGGRKGRTKHRARFFNMYN
jgi:hypothetical protein